MQQYLDHYAEPETTALEPLLDRPGGWEQVLVIPACDETAGFLRAPPPCGGRSLLILVINESAKADNLVSEANQRLASAVSRSFNKQWQSEAGHQRFGISLWADQEYQRDVLVIDRFSSGRRLPEKGGVGYARKIGADLAAFLFHHGKIRSCWIHCSDGDTRLPDTYFSASAGFGQDHSALVYPYRHVEDMESDDRDEINRTTQRYELALRYYVAGLRFAVSPYAFHTIGSTMALNARHYARVRGFPRREAGEDFYLLNKLAKVGKIHELETEAACKPIEIMSRRSNRVPFGTGAAVNRITSLDDPANDYLYYHPGIFKLLHAWLSCLPELWARQGAQLDEDLFYKHNMVEIDKKSLVSVLEQIGTRKALEHAFRQSKDVGQFQRQMHTWFDAFRTLKFIHAIRDQNLPSISLVELSSTPVFLHMLATDESLAAVHRVIADA